MITLDTLHIVFPAIIVAILITATHVPLGQEVLKRGIIFIDLAIAQIAGLGVVISKLYLTEYFAEYYHIYIIQITALLFALIAAYIFMVCEKKVTNLHEAIIGSSYIFSSSLALLILSNNSHGGEEIQDMLAGQILWVNFSQIIVTTIIYGVTLIIWFLSKEIRSKYFYFIFAISII